MNRHAKWAVTFAGVALLLIVWCSRAGAGDEAKPVLPDAVREAERTYTTEVEELRAEFADRERELFGEHIERLKSLQQECTVAGDLDGALATRARIEELRNPPEPAEEKEKQPIKVGIPMDTLRGAWAVNYSNNTRHTRRFHGRNQVNEDAHLYRRGGDLIIDFHAGNAIERITVAEDCFFVEHFNPKKTYPKGRPIVMGIAEKLE